MFINTIKYVSPSKTNEKTYSEEYAKIVLLCGSEIDSILKLICKIEKVKPRNKDYNMNDYSDVIINKIKLDIETYTPNCMTTTNEKYMMITPFKTIKKGAPYGGLEWWKDYQSLKHDRVKNATVGNLKNAASLLIAHYILITHLINYLDESSGFNYVKEHNISNVLIPCL